MRRLVLVALCALCAVNLMLAGTEVMVEWVKPSEKRVVAGMYIRVTASIEIYDFAEKICMISYQPPSSSSDQDTVVLGWTDGGKWTLTRRGLLKVACKMLTKPVYFAYVRVGGERALLRLNDADCSPPLHLDSDAASVLLYREQKYAISGEPVTHVQADR
jgi:hypothetical protein